MTLFGDPRPPFAAMGVDLALMSDRVGFGGACGYPPMNASQRASAARAAAMPNFNSGFFLLRVGPAALLLWSTVQDYHRNHPLVMQQAALNAVLDEKRYLARGALAHRMRRTLDMGGMRLRLAALDEATFLNGHCFYERRPLRTDATSVMAVHHNYISGDDRKIERARAHHAIPRGRNGAPQPADPASSKVRDRRCLGGEGTECSTRSTQIDHSTRNRRLSGGRAP